VLDAIAPAGDEIVLSKTSSSVFISTNIDYVLRNLGVRQLVIAGLLSASRARCATPAISAIW
jgi:ureidoacrylate peracid hydrolase